MAGIPEYSIKDMVNWFRFVAASHPRLLSGLEASLSSFNAFCVNFVHGFINTYEISCMDL